MEAKHTPGPLEVIKCSRNIRTVLIEPVRRMAVADVIGRGDDAQIKVDADRLASCYNACEGISDPSVVGELVELLGLALYEVKKTMSPELRERIEAALAKATQL